MKKIVIIMVFMLLITASLLPVTTIVWGISITKGDSNVYIFTEIKETKDKLLNTDTIIGDIHVKYWEHYIDDILVQGDSILLHLDVDNTNVIKYEKTWTDIEIVLPDYEYNSFEPYDYAWKRIVVFPEEEDLTYFYTFYNQQEYPLVCWEVRNIDGTTKMYSLNGNIIGEGIPAPQKIWNGFSCSGYDPTVHDPWIQWRQDADSWFQKWCLSTTSISLPSAATISSNVKNFFTRYFFELCHGDSNQFQCSATDFYYSSGSYPYTVQNDMQSRLPMIFAFIGSCEGMRYTGPGSFSHELRKGQMTGTVTVGYVGMATCPGWSVALPWQQYMFSMIDGGATIKSSFDSACTQYPTIAPCVSFVGDTNLKMRTKNINNLENVKTNSLEITMPQNRAINKPFLNFLQNHPSLFPILNRLLQLLGLQ